MSGLGCRKLLQMFFIDKTGFLLDLEAAVFIHVRNPRALASMLEAPFLATTLSHGSCLQANWLLPGRFKGSHSQVRFDPFVTGWPDHAYRYDGSCGVIVSVDDLAITVLVVIASWVSWVVGVPVVRRL